MKPATLVDNIRGDLKSLTGAVADAVARLDTLQCDLPDETTSNAQAELDEIAGLLRASYLDVEKEMGLLRDCAEPDGNDT